MITIFCRIAVIFRRMSECYVGLTRVVMLGAVCCDSQSDILGHLLTAFGSVAATAVNQLQIQCVAWRSADGALAHRLSPQTGSGLRCQRRSSEGC